MSGQARNPEGNGRLAGNDFLALCADQQKDSPQSEKSREIQVFDGQAAGDPDQGLGIGPITVLETAAARPLAEFVQFRLGDFVLPHAPYDLAVDPPRLVGTAVAESLPQTFRLALITHAGSTTTVKIIPVNADETAHIPVQIGNNGIQDVVLVVTATTRLTLEKAAYQFEIR